MPDVRTIRYRSPRPGRMAWHRVCIWPDRTGCAPGTEIVVMIEAVLLDIDGTLIDNNALHLLAWQRALRRVGRHVDATTILHKLGMGSDKLPAAILRSEEHTSE